MSTEDTPLPKIVAIPPDTTCEYEGCTEPATVIVQGPVKLRGLDLVIGVCCDTHATVVADWSEYVVSCPNCGCRFGV